MSLRQKLEGDDLVIAPGIFDMVSALTAERVGFDALYLTGYGVSASHLGKPDAGFLTYRDMVDRARIACETVATPIIADADTGFGGPPQVAETVRGYERAGLAAIQIEDQHFPKRCGHTPGREVIAAEDMMRKIEVAAGARVSDDFLIIARTDARTDHGLEAAIARAASYAEAGADILFVESPESEEELRLIGQAFAKKGSPFLMANMVAGGRTPIVPSSKLKELGFHLAIYPTYGLGLAAAALTTGYESLKTTGAATGDIDEGGKLEALNDLVRFSEIWQFDD